MDTLVTVIIPVYNREKVLSETLESVLNQSHTNWECLIIDDGSTDDTIKVVNQFIKKDKRFNLYKRDSNHLKGPAACRNLGLFQAKGDYVIFLDSDDILHENCLENRLKYVFKNPEYDVWVFNMAFLDGKNKGKICNYYPTDVSSKKEFLKMTLRYQLPFSVTCPLWRIEALKDLKGFDESFLRLEDPDLHCRALSKQYRFLFNKTSAPDCYYRVGTNNTNRDEDVKFKDIFIKSFYQFIDKYAGFKSEIIDNNEVKKQLNILLLRVFKDYILNDKYFFKQFEIFYSLGKNKKILNFYELVILFITKRYKKNEWDKISGTGFYKIRKIIFKKIDKVDSLNE
ncbi:MAG: glycosyltransferase family 2 protein [Flavobacteriaceae bacterium]